jgi:hypothetical protein
MYDFRSKHKRIIRTISGRKGTIAVTAMIILGCIGALVWARDPQPTSKQAKDKSVQEEILVRRLVIVDDKGDKRATLGLMRDGEVRLEFCNKQKEVSTWLDADGVVAPSFGVMRAGEKPLVELGAEKGKLPVIMMRDASGTRRISSVVAPDGTASLLLSDSQGKTRCRLSVSDNGEPEVVLSDTGGRPRAHLLLKQENETCGLNLYDSKGRVRMILQLGGKDGEPALIACDSKEKPIWSALKQDRAD